MSNLGGLTRAPVSQGGFFRQAPVHVRLVAEHIVAKDATETVSRDGDFTLLAQTRRATICL